MLVLSRRTNEKIIFPNLDITLQVLQVKGKVVKLGIEAPQNIPILRHEVDGERKIEPYRKNVDAGIDQHELRNRLNTVNLGIQLLIKQSERGMDQAASDTLDRVVQELQKLDKTVGVGKERVKQSSQASALKLLVVEDDANERELLAGLLRLHGFEVQVAASGAEALDYLGTHEAPDYVLLDMKMPQVDGPETLRQIRSDSRLANLKVLAVSGTPPDSLGVSENDYSGWFPKPLDPQRLIEAMITSSHSRSVSAV